MFIQYGSLKGIVTPRFTSVFQNVFAIEKCEKWDFTVQSFGGRNAVAVQSLT